VYKYSPSKERNEWKVQDNHLDAFMDDNSSLPKTQTQAIKSNCLWVRRGSLVESLKSSKKEEDNRVVVRIKTRINRGQKQGGRLFFFFLLCLSAFYNYISFKKY